MKINHDLKLVTNPIRLPSVGLPYRRLIRQVARVAFTWKAKHMKN